MTFSGTVNCYYYEYDDSMECGGERCWNLMTRIVSNENKTIALYGPYDYVYECTNGCEVVNFSHYDCGGGSSGDVDGEEGGGGGGSGGSTVDGTLNPNYPETESCTDVGYNPSIGSGDGFNKEAFAAYLRAAALPSSSGKCATFVRNALCHGGGITAACNGGPDAGKYGPFLQKLGFTVMTTGSGLTTPSGFVPQVGDIAVFIYGSNGHVCAWDGSQWISDFKQNTIQPNQSYPEREYTIYRKVDTQ